MLLEYGLNLNLKNVVGETALHTAARMSQIEAFNFLVHEEAELEAKDDQQQTPLHKAAERGFEWGVKKLVDFNCEVNAHDAQGHSPRLQENSWVRLFWKYSPLGELYAIDAS